MWFNGAANVRSRKFGNFTLQHTREQPGLDLQQAPVPYSVVGQRVRDRRVHPQLVRPEKCLAPDVNATEPPTRTKSRNVSMPVLIALSTAESTINGRNWLHQVQRQRRAPEAGLMEKADIRVQPHRVTQVLGEQAAARREQRVHVVARRTPVAPLEVEWQVDRLLSFAGLDHASEIPKVQPCPVAFQPQQLLDQSRLLSAVRHVLQARQRRAVRLYVVALQ